MESILEYGHNSNNSKARDNPSLSTKSYGNCQSRGHSDANAGSRRRKTDDTNYEEIQMELSEDSDSSDAHSSPAKIGDVKPKKIETDPVPQSTHNRSDRHNRFDEKSSSSSSKDVDRYKSDKSKESSSRDRFAEKSRDKAEKYRNRDRDRDYERDRDRDRHSRDKGRNRPEKDDKYARHRDSRRDRNDRNDRNDQRRSDKDRYDRGRDRHNTTRSKSKSRSRSRDNSSRDNLPAPRPHQQHDRSAIKEPPKSLMSLQLPQMPLVAASVSKQMTPLATSTVAITAAAAAAAATAAPLNLISPLLASARYTEQMQKRKLLWGNKKPVEGEQQTTNNKWEQTKFSQDSDGKMATKFLRLMGMKDAPKVADDETQKAPDSIKKQNEMLSTMEQQYEVARQMTHTMRGMGLGFGTQPRNY